MGGSAPGIGGGVTIVLPKSSVMFLQNESDMRNLGRVLGRAFREAQRRG